MVPRQGGHLPAVASAGRLEGVIYMSCQQGGSTREVNQDD